MSKQILGKQKYSLTRGILALRHHGEGKTKEIIKKDSSFIDFRQAFDNNNQDVTWHVIESYGVDSRVIVLLVIIISNSASRRRSISPMMTSLYGCSLSELF